MNRLCRQMMLPTILCVLLLPSCDRDRSLNLIIVLVDTMRADHAAMHGYTRPVTPHLAALAERSTVFLNHHAHASRTGPSVASLLTGLHPPSHGVVNPLTHFDAKGTLTDEVTTLAEVLADRGYECHGIVANMNVSARFGFAQGYTSYTYRADVRAGEIGQAALDIVQRSAGPFFLYLHYMEPHSPYRAPAAYRDRWLDPAYIGTVDGSHRQLDAVVAGDRALNAADVARLEALYDQEIAYFDDQLDALLAGLAAGGRADDTLLLFVADHGEEFLEHGSVLHGYTLYEEQLHVPCLLFDPERPESRRIDAVTRQVDLMPTLLARLGVPTPDGVQGEDLTALMRDAGDSGDADDQTGRGDKADDARPVYALASLHAVKTVKAQSLQLGRWKYIHTTIPEPRAELYDLWSDPDETEDLNSSNPDQAAAMQRRLDAFIGALPIVEGGAVTLTPAEKERLRSLGYLN